MNQQDNPRPAPRTFSAGESDAIFNMAYSESVSFADVAAMLADITGKATTADDVEREYRARQ